MITPRQWAHQHDYQIVEVFGGAGSTWVAQMTTPSRETVLVKAASRRVRASWGEAACWQAWDAIEGIPKLLMWDEVNGISVREWVDGESLEDPQTASHTAGAFLHQLHISAPPSMQPLDDWTATITRRFHAQDTPAHRLALTALQDAPGTGDCVLHGDYHRGNIIVTDTGLSTIDPYGYRGDPSFDIATYIITAYGSDRLNIARDILDGYGSTPATLGPVSVWFGVTHAGFLRSIGEPDATLDEWIYERLNEDQPYEWYKI